MEKINKEVLEDVVQEAVDQALETKPVEPVYETVEKITPGYHDISWWIKWTATIFSILGAMFTTAISVNQDSIFVGYNIPFSAIGLVGWTVVGSLWRDNSIIIMNTFLLGAFTLGLMQILDTPTVIETQKVQIESKVWEIPKGYKLTKE